LPAEEASGGPDSRADADVFDGTTEHCETCHGRDDRNRIRFGIETGTALNEQNVSAYLPPNPTSAR
jgi:hypothetical protein